MTKGNPYSITSYIMLIVAAIMSVYIVFNPSEGRAAPTYPNLTCTGQVTQDSIKRGVESVLQAADHTIISKGNGFLHYYFTHKDGRVSEVVVVWGNGILCVNILDIHIPH